MDLRRWCKFWIIKAFLLLCMHGIGLSGYQCSPGLNFPGYTFPQGDILIKYGNPLNITCVLNDEKVYPASSNPSRSLFFRRNNETIPREMIEVLNSTAIRLYIDKPPKVSGDMYACSLDNNKTVCMNFVSVGVAPQKVVDFECQGYNFEYLRCEWTAPKNYVTTDYDLRYDVSSRSSRLPPLSCPEIKSPDRYSPNGKMSCFWNISTTPYYRQVHDIFNFTLNMTNIFGTNHIVETFKHFAHVKSGPPENLTVLSSTPSSLYLRWKVPPPMRAFPPGVHHRIQYNCHFEGKGYRLGALLTSTPNQVERRFNLTNLKYAYDLCEIVVQIRSSKALPNDETMWSDNATIYPRTQSKLPDRPPEITVGSFEESTAGTGLKFKDAFIYWRQIEDNEKNGPSFTYAITVEGDDTARLVKQTETYARFTNLSIFATHKFIISSQNANGSSQRKSLLYMPKQNEKVREPSDLYKVELGDGQFELSWEAPILRPWERITNYTIFWCNNDRDRPYHCEGKLDWKIVTDKTETKVKVNGTQNYQFAIAANTHNSTSGMLWASCVILHSQNMRKIKNVWVNNFGSTFIELGWKIECSDHIGSVKGFIIYYCPLKSDFNRDCEGPQRNQTFIGGTTLVHGNVTNLLPNTKYMLTVAAIIKSDTYSQPSDPLFNTTSEDAPNSPPQNISVLTVTNSSISLQWDPPILMNGVLREYKIYYNELVLHNIKDTQATLRNLEGYTNYSISLEACTVKCSRRSNSINIPTEMGVPSQIPKPTVDRRNDTTISIIWSKPAQPRGRNDYYDVSFKQKFERGNRTTVHNVSIPRYVIENCGDGGKYNTFYVSVRAVNNVDGKPWPGDWSEELENYCDTPVSYLMFILAVVVILFFVAMAFLFNRLYHHCQAMRDVEVKLPPGLGSAVATEHTLVPWNTDIRLEKPDAFAPPDEELLLIKMSDGRHFSGDSSGCSSGHESVTSSLESGTHISSNSDSGTEQTGGNYCVLGLGPDPKIDSSYVCDVVTESSPYVMTGDPVKTVNPGYVSFDQTEQMAKSPTGYVVAGIKNCNGYVVAGVKNVKLD